VLFSGGVASQGGWRGTMVSPQGSLVVQMLETLREASLSPTLWKRPASHGTRNHTATPSCRPLVCGSFEVVGGKENAIVVLAGVTTS
jgi:hypothetical protein